MKKVTLLATTGASPQVITETLYAIHHENQQWPDDIYLITTSFGKRRAVEGLLEQRHLQRLCDELHRPMPAFDASHILVTPGADGAEVEDARSLQDHEALANFIMTEVRNRTADDATSLHASLAGGRKTMTFYLGYAMSLFGRTQDILSHVLVSDGYEGLSDFWFPTDDESHRHLETRDGLRDAAAARVTLAPIPFVRHRRVLPPVLLQLDATLDFTQLVQLINLGDSPEALRVEVNLPERWVRLHDADKKIIDICFEPSLIDLAFYTMLVRATLKNEKDYGRPAKETPDKGMVKDLANELLCMHNRHKGEILQENLKILEDLPGIKPSTVDALKNGISQSWFDQRKNTLTTLFGQKLPPSLVRWVVPSTIWAEDGSRLSVDDIDKTTKGGGYGIPLKEAQISIIE